MPSKIVLMIAGLSLGATLTLTGCSGGQTSSSSAAPAGTSTTASSGTTPAGSSTQSSSSSSSSGSSGSSSTPAQSGGDDSSAKPSKSAIITGLTRFYVTKQNLSQDKAKKFATCMVGKMYDKASAKSLRAMEDGDPSSLDRSDAALLTSSAGACAGALQ